MDTCETLQLSQKYSTSAAARKPLVPAENKNGVSHESRTREISSRHRSVTPSVGSSTKRYPSPNARNTSFPATPSAPNRASLVEKKRPLRSSSPTFLSTPVQDTAEGELFARKQASSKLPESLWPSTMRSLTVSFQSDSYLLPVSKSEKPASHASYDRIPRISSNVTHKQTEGLTSRKPTPERKRSPVKGRNFVDQLENSKPVDSLPPRLVDQHRWPSKTTRKVATALTRSIDLTDMPAKFSSLSSSGNVSPSFRRFSLDGPSKSLLKSSSDLLMQLPGDGSRMPIHKLGSSMSSDRLQLGNAAARALSSHNFGIRPLSPSMSRGNSPPRLRTVPSLRGPSPARLRQSSPSRKGQISTSVLSFIVDMKKGKKAANHIDNVHQLRMLYNRHSQWRYANAQADAALQSQKVKAEKMLCRVSRLISVLWDSILEKRMLLLQIKLRSKLHSVLSNQLTPLDDWALIEKDHISNLSYTVQDLQATTIRIPVTAGARAEIKSLKAALCCALDILQAVATSLCPTLPRVQEMNCLLSELADMAAYEGAFLGGCESVLCSINTLQGEEYSLRTHLLQLKQASMKRGTQSFLH